MNAWDQDRRRSGGDGWILDANGDWVATSGEPEVPETVVQAALAMPGRPSSAARIGRAFRAVMTVVVIPAIAASAVLFMWKGPGGEMALDHLRPFVTAVREARAPEAAPRPEPTASVSARPEWRGDAPSDVDAPAPSFDGHTLPNAAPCASVRRGMRNGIVFHRTGRCPD